MKPLALIVAMARNGGIGLKGALPWHVPEDLKRFKALTMGHAIIMGRKTYGSIGRPLPGRRNLVVSRTLTQLEGCEVVGSLEAALALCTADALPFIIGGAELYAQALPLVTHLFLTKVDRLVEADTFFPELKTDAWDQVHSENGSTADVTFVDLVRRSHQQSKTAKGV